MEENCREMEELSNKHDYFNLHKKLKKITDNTRKWIPMVTRNIRGEIQLTEDYKKKMDRAIKNSQTEKRQDSTFLTQFFFFKIHSH